MSTTNPAVSPLRVAIASFIGTTVEFYDFLIYGTAAAVVFPKLFFPNMSPASGLLLSFTTFGVGFVARPLGGIVFGHFGDRVGRKRMLIYSLLVMRGATVLMGALPTYAHIGLAAPIRLTLLRLAQGFAVSGERGGPRSWPSNTPQRSARGCTARSRRWALPRHGGTSDLGGVGVFPARRLDARSNVSHASPVSWRSGFADALTVVVPA